MNASAECGVSNRAQQKAGTLLEANEFPWLALVYDVHDVNTVYAGTLISERYVVSAARSFYG